MHDEAISSNIFALQCFPFSANFHLANIGGHFKFLKFCLQSILPRHSGKLLQFFLYRKKHFMFKFSGKSEQLSFCFNLGLALGMDFEEYFLSLRLRVCFMGEIRHYESHLVLLQVLDQQGIQSRYSAQFSLHWHLGILCPDFRNFSS